MELIKKGSKGTSVILLQQKLNITADGIFGSGTEKAVKDFQKSKGVTADGIVGPTTWKLLGVVDSTPNNGSVECNIIKSPLNVHVTKSPNRDIKYIVIHYTAGASSSTGRAAACKSVFEQRSASADFVVDDTQIIQFNPDLKNYYCWAVGDKKNPYSGGGSFSDKASNKNTINIEMCSTLTKGTSAAVANHDGWYFTNAVISNTVKLTKMLMQKFNIPVDNVIRHYDVTGKLCPGIVGWNRAVLYDSKSGKCINTSNNDSQWQNFKSKLK